jgi:hypothetical protein
MRKTLFLALLCSLSLVGCMQPSDEGDLSDPEVAKKPKPPKPPHPTPDAAVPPATCADIDQFDLDVFADEIMPILTGAVDLNDPGGTSPGCTRGACHGTDRGPDALFLAESETAANNLSRFSCFVDLANPPASQVLVCPLNDPGCVLVHPGADVFSGVDDLNYQRVLSYLQDSAAGATP